jgi:hypothetical protein
VGAVDLAQLAHLVDLLEPAAQAAILHPLLRSRLNASARHADLRGQNTNGPSRIADRARGCWH